MDRAKNLFQCQIHTQDVSPPSEGLSWTADKHRAAQHSVKEPIIANFGKIVDSSRSLVKTQKLATTCSADHIGKSRVVQAVGFMVKPLDP